MRLGNKRYRARFDRPDVAIDSHGDALKGWQQVATGSVSLEADVGDEATAGMRIESQATHRIEFQRQVALAAMTPNWRIRVELPTSPLTFRTFDVLELVPLDNRTRALAARCRERI